MARSYNETWIAKFAVDGGIDTGLCYGVFPRKGDTKEQVRRAKKGGILEFEHIGSKGAYKNPEQNTVHGTGGLLDHFISFNEQLKAKGLFPCKVLLEDFTLRKMNMTRHLLQSVRVCVAFESALYMLADEGMEFLYEPTYYDPSQSKTVVTNDRLKRWGLWEVGMDHARDAARLIALDLRKDREGAQSTQA